MSTAALLSALRRYHDAKYCGTPVIDLTDPETPERMDNSRSLESSQDERKKRRPTRRKQGRCDNLTQIPDEVLHIDEHNKCQEWYIPGSTYTFTLTRVQLITSMWNETSLSPATKKYILDFHGGICPQFGQMNDEIINAYFYLLINSIPATSLNAFAVYSLIQLTKKYKSRNLYDAVRRIKYDYILFPLHIKGNHWVLYVVDSKQKSIRLYDTLQNNSPLLFDDVFTFLKNQYQEQFNVPDEEICDLFGTWTRECTWEPTTLFTFRQVGITICGVFICEIARRILHDIVIDNDAFQKINYEDMRRDVLKFIRHNPMVEEKIT